MALVIGLAGTIAAGKSTVGQVLAARGAIHCDGDKLVHRLYDPGTPGFERVVAAFGPEVVGADGFVDRKVLGARVFGKPDEMNKLTTAIGSITDIVGDPVIDRDRVIVAGNGGEMAAFDTLRGQRVWDVRRGLAVLRGIGDLKGVPLWLQGKRDLAGIVLYAGLFEPDVARFDLWQPPASHRQGPIFLNILRHTDIPEAAALLAPRRLNFYGRIPKEFEYTKHVYELLGQGSRMHLSMDIGAVVEGRYDHNYASGY